MYEVSKSFRFEASHVLPNHDGKCARMHGHSWVATLAFRGYQQTEGPSIGMVVDYSVISLYFNPVVHMYLDHYHLNTSLELVNPTSEEVAYWIARRVLMAFPPPIAALLYSVTVEETCTSKATYYVPGPV